MISKNHYNQLIQTIDKIEQFILYGQQIGLDYPIYING